MSPVPRAGRCGIEISFQVFNGESHGALIAAEQLDDYHRFKEAEHLSMLKAFVEAAEDIGAGRVDTWDEFKPRLAKLRTKAKRIAGTRTRRGCCR